MFYLHDLLYKVAMLIFLKLPLDCIPPARNGPTEFPAIWNKIQNPPVSKSPVRLVFLPVQFQRVLDLKSHLPLPTCFCSSCNPLIPPPWHLHSPLLSSARDPNRHHTLVSTSSMTLFSHCDLSWPSFASTFFTLAYILCNTTVTYFSRMHAYKEMGICGFFFHFTPSAWCGNSEYWLGVFAAHRHL